MKRSSLILLFLLNAAPLCAQAPPEKYGWSFVNFTTPVFDWDIFRNAMIAIPPDSSGITAPFDLLFYNGAFKSALSAGGNCFGLSLMSLVMNKDGGQLGYCCPTNFYGGSGSTGPTDAKLTRAINIMHGHQVTLACIQSFFDQVIGGHSQLGHYGKDILKQIIDKEGPCLVSITKSFSPSSGGHTLIAYEVKDLGGGHFHIMVVDPNRIWADTTGGMRTFYSSDSNYIDIGGSVAPNSGVDDWNYNMIGSLGIWKSGDHGHLTGIPVSLAGPTGRVPTSLGLAIGELMSKLFISDVGRGLGGTIVQVRNSEGKHLFKPGDQDIDWGVTIGMRSMVPFFPSDAVGQITKFPFELYFNMGAMPNAEIDFRSGSKGSMIVYGDNTGFVKVTCDDADVAATLVESGIGTSSPSVSIKSASKRMNCDIEILIPTKTGEINRTFSLHNIEILPGEKSNFTCSIMNARDIRVSGNSQKGSTFSIIQEALDPSKAFTTEAISITPSNEAMWNEEQWEYLKKMPLQHLTGK